MQLNINTEAARKFTNSLNEISKSAIPVSVRGALNDTAFDVKTNTMPRKAQDIFVLRQNNFFKANSRVEPAVGFNVNSMSAAVGFYENKLVNSRNNYAVKDLEQQEDGGLIGGRSFIPLPAARTGNSNKGKVKSSLRITKIQKSIIIEKSYT